MADAAPSNNAMLYLILRYLQDRNLFNSARALERETGIIFNTNHFENLILSDMLDEAENYLKGFTSLDDNVYSRRVYFLLRQLKFLESVRDGARWCALDIAVNDLQSFDLYDTRIYERACQLLTMEDPSDHPMMRDFEEEAARIYVAQESKICIASNPVLSGKLEFPPLLTILQLLFANEPPIPDGTLTFFLINNYLTPHDHNRNRNRNCNDSNIDNYNCNLNGNRNNHHPGF